MKMFTVLSLGAGVQSTTLALMAMHGLIEKPNYAIFANTGWESRQTLEHLGELKKLLDFPVFTVDNGNLHSDLLMGLTGIVDNYFTPVPFFTTTGIGKRQCTYDFKIVPVKRKVRELLGASVRSRLFDKYVNMQIGISLDECHRAKPSKVKYIEHVNPLLDLRMTRLDCENWLKRHGYKIPPKSACIGCPFHSNQTWQVIKSDLNSEFQQAVEVDTLLREREFKEFMHKSLKPLENITFKNTGQVDLFGNECDGFCNL